MQRTTNPLPLLAHLGDRLLHLVAPVTLVVVPGATPHLLVMCVTHKRPKPSMSGHLEASAPAPPAVLSIGRHALHITSSIDRHRCAEATDVAAPLAKASLPPETIYLLLLPICFRFRLRLHVGGGRG